MEASAACSPPYVACSAASSVERGEVSDDDLAVEAAGGSREAFGILAGRYQGRVYAFALTMLQSPDDAEDVAQETLVRALRGLAGYQPRGCFRAWLFRIAGNLCRDRLRQASSREIALEPAVLERCVGAEPGEAHEQAELRAALLQAVGRLPQTYRAPVVLHYMEGLTVAEAAQALGRTTAALKIQLWRARGMLARELAGWEEGR